MLGSEELVENILSSIGSCDYPSLKQLMEKYDADDQLIDDLNLESSISCLCQNIQLIDDDTLRELKTNNASLALAIVIFDLPKEVRKDAIITASTKQDGELPLQVLKSFLNNKRDEMFLQLVKKLSKEDFDELYNVLMGGRDYGIIKAVSQRRNNITDQQKYYFLDVLSKIDDNNLYHKNCSRCKGISEKVNTLLAIHNALKKWS